MDKRQWFHDCLWYREAPQAFRKASSIHYTYLRIACMAKEIGEALDAICPPLRVYRFVAYARSKPGVKLRHALVLRLRAVLGRWPTDAQMYLAESSGEPAPGSAR